VPRTTRQPNTQEDGFKEVPSRKRQNTEETAGTSNKSASATSAVVNTPLKQVETRNYLAPSSPTRDRDTGTIVAGKQGNSSRKNR
jgi:hypothetical protein